jgi:hypothetical protein
MGRGSRRILQGTIVVLGLAMAAGAGAGAFAGDDDPVEEPGITNKVTLQLQLSGLSKQGCVVEIRPAHPACKFKPMKFKVGGLAADRAVALDPITFEARSTGADRDCSFAITVREPGQAPRTFQRGLRLIEPTAEKPLPEKTLKCYLSAAALATRPEAPARRR